MHLYSETRRRHCFPWSWNDRTCESRDVGHVMWVPRLKPRAFLGVVHAPNHEASSPALSKSPQKTISGEEFRSLWWVIFSLHLIKCPLLLFPWLGIFLMTFYENQPFNPKIGTTGWLRSSSQTGKGHCPALSSALSHIAFPKFDFFARIKGK